MVTRGQGGHPCFCSQPKLSAVSTVPTSGQGLPRVTMTWYGGVSALATGSHS